MEREIRFSFFNWPLIYIDFFWKAYAKIKEELRWTKLKELSGIKLAFFSLVITFPMFFFATLWPTVTGPQVYAEEVTKTKPEIKKIAANLPAGATTVINNLPKTNGWVWPVRGIIYSGWGWRYGGRHEGLDIVNRFGTKILAARNGVVVTANSGCAPYSYGCGGGYGNYVSIRHPDGLYSIYGHLSKVVVIRGQTVSAGEVIGEMGTTGRSSAVHLHFGIGRNAWVNYNTLNPLAYLPKI